MAIPNRLVLIIITSIVLISALFCIIGLSTKRWYGDQIGIFEDGTTVPPRGLSIIAFILLIVTIISFVLEIIGILGGRLRLVPIILTFLSSIFLLATFTAAATPGFGSSFDLMVVAHFFSYIALAVATFLLGLPENS